MESVVMQVFQVLFKLAVEQLDLLLVVAIVLIVQMAKRNLPKVPKKAWYLVMLGLGFFTAWIVMPTVAGHSKEYLRKSIIYSAGAEFVYQSWRTLSEMVKSIVKSYVAKVRKT